MSSIWQQAFKQKYAIAAQKSSGMRRTASPMFHPPLPLPCLGNGHFQVAQPVAEGGGFFRFALQDGKNLCIGSALFNQKTSQSKVIRAAYR
jgi:hypothetical protein